MQLNRADLRRRDQGNNWIPSQSVATLPANGTIEQAFDVVVATVRIRLLAADGSPVGDTEVILAADQDGRVHRLGASGADGRIEGQVAPGEFAVQWEPARTVRGRVTAAAGAIHEVELWEGRVGRGRMRGAGAVAAASSRATVPTAWQSHGVAARKRALSAMRGDCMIDDDELARLQKVARDAAAAEAARLHAVVPTEEIEQEAWSRFLKQVRGIDLPTETDRRGYLIGIVGNVAAELVRQFVRRSVAVGLEADIGEVLDLAVAAPIGRDLAEIEAIARRFFLDAGLDSKDVALCLLVRLDRMGWRQAGAAAGLTDQQVEAARKRISRFLSDSGVLKRLLVVLGIDEPRAPRAPPNDQDPGGQHEAIVPCVASRIYRDVDQRWVRRCPGPGAKLCVHHHDSMEWRARSLATRQLRSCSHMSMGRGVVRACRRPRRLHPLQLHAVGERGAVSICVLLHGACERGRCSTGAMRGTQPVHR